MNSILMKFRTLTSAGISLIAVSAVANADTGTTINPDTDGTILVMSYDIDDQGTVAPKKAGALVSSTGVMKIVNGYYVAAVDNGWAVIEGVSANPTLNFYYGGPGTVYSSGLTFKLIPRGTASIGLYDAAGGLTWAPCNPSTPPATGQKNRCYSPGGGAAAGVGLGYGVIQNPGSPFGGGWVNDFELLATYTAGDGFSTSATNAVTGSIAKVAAGTNGAYAVGWSQDANAKNHSLILSLDSAGQTYDVTGSNDFGTFASNNVSQALSISKNATYVVGYVTAANGKTHAAYASPTASAWTDISTVLGASVPGVGPILSSQAFAASDSGNIAGIVNVRTTLVGHKNYTSKVGFIYNIGFNTVSFFPSPVGLVLPVAVTESGTVVGNIELIPAFGQPTTPVPAYHPFSASGTVITDYGVMGTNWGCRVALPNHIGQMVGSCIPANPNGAASPVLYGAGGTAFLIDTTAATPAYVNLNADLHSLHDAALVQTDFPTFSLGIATAIDDEGEITLVGFRPDTASPTGVYRGGFLAGPGGY